MTKDDLIKALYQALFVAERRGDALKEEGIEPSTQEEILMAQATDTYWAAMKEKS